MIAALAVAGTVTSCTQRHVQIAYIFPDGFRGTFVLKGEDPTGETLHESNGVYILRVPASGILAIRGRLPSHEWHSSSARYESGPAIRVAAPPNEVSDEQQAFRPIGSKSNSEDWFVVGTRADATAAREKLWGFNWTLRPTNS